MYNKAHKLFKVCEEQQIPISQATLLKQQQDTGRTPEELTQRFLEIYQVMKESSSKGLHKEIISMSGLTGGNAKKMNDYIQTGQSLSGDFHLRAMARAFSTLEVNGSMGKIVAAPTAGASGILPAALVSIQDKLQLTDTQMVKGLLTASAIGGIVAMSATISGAEGGCQAETGTAAAMAAAALVELNGGTPEQAFHAASIAIINILGLVCDPIGGLVEFPCALRNASGVMGAIIACDMAMAGVKSIVPFDEVVESMYAVGDSLPMTLRETALGGLAVTNTAKNLCAGCKK